MSILWRVDPEDSFTLVGPLDLVGRAGSRWGRGDDRGAERCLRLGRRRGRSGDQGKPEREAGSFAHSTFNTNASLVGLDDFATQRQPQSGSALSLKIGCLGRKERFENLPKLFFRDARAGVANQDLSHVVLDVPAHGDHQLATVFHRLAGIDDEIQQDLLYLAGVDLRVHLIFESSLQSDLMFLQVLFNQDHDILNHLDQVDRFPSFV